MVFFHSRQRERKIFPFTGTKPEVNQATMSLRHLNRKIPPVQPNILMIASNACSYYKLNVIKNKALLKYASYKHLLF